MSETLDRLIQQFPRTGLVAWIGIRLGRKADVLAVDRVMISMTGLEGDHRATPGKRAVSLIQAEHLPVIAALVGMEHVNPGLLRRNIVISGINLLALRKMSFRIGDVVLHGSGPCAPCTRMESGLGTGGFNAMRGHGGITAEVVTEGRVMIGDTVQALP